MRIEKHDNDEKSLNMRRTEMRTDTFQINHLQK